ncbi:hypothetical protein [uncultured Aquimarina sp.]|uniref:hypothetical protein n=1 Tax=uncultured Aquimarina sp. TaxID=575652 RepID=UPI0026204E47|nr:hypothetical protein [uncultured Aquimarina sp.]
MKKHTLLLILLIVFSYPSNSQSIETKLYLKEELVKQREELLKQVREIQQRIDAIDQELGNTSNSTSNKQYLTKSVNYNSKSSYYNSINSSTTKKKRYRFKPNRKYIRGSRGGCYYINSNGNKTYVDRSLCN